MKNLILSALLIIPVLGQELVSENEELLPVFRCVLDERPRILVTLLGEKRDHALAFHTESGTLWKAWESDAGKPPVELVGALYDGKHGPQPVSQGKMAFVDDKPQLFCSGKDARLQYLGHVLRAGDSASLRWAFKNADGKNLAIIQVTPELKGEETTLTYRVASPPPGGIAISVRKPGSSDAPVALKADSPVVFKLAL